MLRLNTLKANNYLVYFFSLTVIINAFHLDTLTLHEQKYTLSTQLTVIYIMQQRIHARRLTDDDVFQMFKAQVKLNILSLMKSNLTFPVASNIQPSTISGNRRY